MSIRSAAKAIILHDGKILLNKCNSRGNGVYYALPGGGQHPYETLHEAVVRECLEETGYRVMPERFGALCEEICVNEGFREKYPDYAHKIYHIFVCGLASETAEIPKEKDLGQTGSEWIEIGALKNIRLLPNAVGENILDIIENKAQPFLGSEHIALSHG